MNLLFWKNKPQVQIEQEIRFCRCGSGKKAEDCHELELVWPDHERPDPD